ncbi:protein DMR6-LIKE OXYGENASE 1-like isoform X9 [Quercus robur]|uniref:protein DMR6-LIKE OXYGENASE 1-like isoform X9 n=1 Tax=Quercus robur TaxID=38942 RepID=UPI002162B3F5|nr:protein DMR6-LIKE OXYGENASE 1-like isoform X9 [Quercus robur]
MGEVDSAFIQPIDHRPKLKPIEVTDEIPVLDLSSVFNSENSDQQLISEIGSACQTWGFFQVINHGVPAELLRKVEAVAKEFFAASFEEKRKVQRDALYPMGYHDSEHTKNVRDWKEVFDFLAHDPTEVPASHEPDDEGIRVLTNQWPQYPPEFREICEEYGREVEKLGFKLLELISLSLGLPEDRLKVFFKDQTSFLRFNYYPPCPSPHLALGVGRHKDGGALSVLAQDDVGGLEVRRKSDGEWIPVKPIPDAYIINIGDAVQVWSNDKYESVEHRVVVNSTKARLSIPFFFFPAHYTMVKPLEELVNEQDRAKYREFNWGKFVANRNRSDFKKQDVENIQISHFRI